MKYLIASDIHGSEHCTQLLLDRFQEANADMLVLLGDLLYHGPRNFLPEGYDPKVVAALLNEHKDHIIAVRGNCDAEVDQMMLDFPCMADYTYLWLSGVPVFITHGHLYNNRSLPPLATPQSILLHGHTHIPANETHSTHRYMNPGSTTMPKEGSAQSYMLIDDNTVTWRHLEDGSVYMEDVLNKEA
ncbi:MAG: phosphodiesterase [Peptococcaceae bacterium]|nr:phosphodiesterase [Peptococcaceae bacterium]